MKNNRFQAVSALAALALMAAIPATAHADILLKNNDRTHYELAIRHKTSTTIVQVPAGTYMVVTEGALNVQARTRRGKPLGDPIEVSDGDRLYLNNGHLTKKTEVAEQ